MKSSTCPSRLIARRGWSVVHTGYACNNRCIFCAQGDLRSSQAPPSDQDVRDSLEQVSTMLVFAGGEPTLRDELPGWVEEARRGGSRRVVVQTNARRLAYRAYAATLARSGVHALDISLQGARAEIHDHHTRAPGSFNQTVAGITSALNERLEVGITTVITRSNFRHLDELVRRAAGMKIRRLHLSFARPLGGALRLRPRVVPLPEMVAPYLKAAGEQAGLSGVSLLISGGPDLPGPQTEDLFAGLGWTEDPPPQAGSSDHG